MRNLTGLTFLLVASASYAQPKQDPMGMRAVEFIPVSLSEAVGSFEKICLASDFDTAAFEKQIAASEWKFQEEMGFGTPRPRILRSRQALVMFHAPPVQQASAFAPGQCNFNFVLPAPVAQAEVAEQVGNTVARVAGVQPTLHSYSGEQCFRWIAKDRIKRVCLVGLSSSAQQVAISFQLWTPRGEARAGLMPS